MMPATTKFLAKGSKTNERTHKETIATHQILACPTDRENHWRRFGNMLVMRPCVRLIV